MTTVASTTIKPIENKNNNQNTVKKNKEKKQIGVGGAVALGTSLAALASVGTYILMRGKCKKLANSAIKLEESLNKYIDDLNIKLQRAIDEKENLKQIFLTIIKKSLHFSLG